MYIQIMGLDQGDNNGIGVPDGEVDRDMYIDKARGQLFFPDRHPFNSDQAYVRGELGMPVYLDESVPEIYLDINRQNSLAASKDYLGISYEKP